MKRAAQERYRVDLLELMLQCSGYPQTGPKTLTSQLIKYGIVGILNTAITFLVIAVLTALGMNPYLCNAIGFGVGLLNSYFLNSRFTFNKKSSTGSMTKFGAAFSIAYAINLFVLHCLVQLQIDSIFVAQFVAMASYNAAFFILMKTWVFSRD
ncbi:GtrA family protein [Brucella thiophenivorans]|nr:GtrA family protein [Brucella thiophenivorans]